MRASGEKIFDYVDPRKRDYQIEMEKIATEHLERIGARLEPRFADLPESREVFPVKASVIIPVRNRVKTIADAVRSALSQKADFPFNVIVVDNHSTDGTTDQLRNLAADNDRLIHIAPARTDYGSAGAGTKRSIRRIAATRRNSIRTTSLFEREYAGADRRGVRFRQVRE